MEPIAQLLQEHISRHPKLEVQDGVKFLYQSFLGPGHLIYDPSVLRRRLNEEWSSIEGDPDAPLYESLGNGLCRLHLNACKGKLLSSNTLLRLFCSTAETVSPQNEAFLRSLSLLSLLPQPKETIEAYIREYRAQGYPSVSHSEAYRSAYHPAYRVVWESFAGLVPILAAIDTRMSQGTPVRVAIDGPCASGKSTLGNTLASLYGCPLFHMDDFFLRPEQRTQQRLEEPGGNVDYERFQEQVLSPLCAGETVRYRPWHCHEGDFGPELVVPPAPLTIVEGSYALRPDLRDHYHLRIWVEVPWSLRAERLIQRGGPTCLERFEQLWVPLENRYFSACQVKTCCHIQYPET